MHAVIMGCGRVGATLAHDFEELGHTVAVVDQDPKAFRRLPTDFSGRTVTGIGFDRQTLLAAGIEGAGAFAAVSSGDNSNIVAARVAREVYQVPYVAARIYDPGRAEIYSRLGIPTVGTVLWTADQMMRRLLPQGSRTDWIDGTGTVRLAQVAVNPGWFGQSVEKVEKATGARVAFLDRLGEGVLPTSSTTLAEGDVVHLLMNPAEAKVIEKTLGAAPEKGR